MPSLNSLTVGKWHILYDKPVSWLLLCETCFRLVPRDLASFRKALGLTRENESSFLLCLISLPQCALVLASFSCRHSCLQWEPLRPLRHHHQQQQRRLHRLLQRRSRLRFQIFHVAVTSHRKQPQLFLRVVPPPHLVKPHHRTCKSQTLPNPEEPLTPQVLIFP